MITVLIHARTEDTLFLPKSELHNTNQVALSRRVHDDDNHPVLFSGNSCAVRCQSPGGGAIRRRHSNFQCARFSALRNRGRGVGDHCDQSGHRSLFGIRRRTGPCSAWPIRLRDHSSQEPCHPVPFGRSHDCRNNQPRFVPGAPSPCFHAGTQLGQVAPGPNRKRRSRGCDHLRPGHD